MKKYFVPIAFIVGVSAGVCGGYYYAKQKYEKAAQEAINEYKDNLKRKESEDVQTDREDNICDSSDSGNNDSRLSSDNDTGSVPVDHESLEKVSEIIDKENYDRYEEKSKNLKKQKAERKENKYSRKHIDYDPIDEPYEDEEEPEDVESLRPSEGYADPYSISYPDFADENSHFEKKSLLYYINDDILIYDETSEQVDDDSMILGDDWRDAIGEYEEGTAYIRNEKISTDFEIIVCYTDFPDSEIGE